MLIVAGFDGLVLELGFFCFDFAFRSALIFPSVHLICILCDVGVSFCCFAGCGLCCCCVVCCVLGVGAVMGV